MSGLVELGLKVLVTTLVLFGKYKGDPHGEGQKGRHAAIHNQALSLVSQQSLPGPSDRTA